MKSAPGNMPGRTSLVYWAREPREPQRPPCRMVKTDRRTVPERPQQSQTGEPARGPPWQTWRSSSFPAFTEMEMCDSITSIHIHEQSKIIPSN